MSTTATQTAPDTATRLAFSVDRDILARELGLLSQVVDRKVTIPIFACAVFDVADDGTVVAVATNGDNSMRSAFSATGVAQPGRVALPADTLLQLVQRFPEGDIYFDVDLSKRSDPSAWGGPRMLLRCGTAKASLPLLPSDDFPQIPSPMDAEFTLTASAWLETIKRCSHILRTEGDTRAEGGRIDVKDGRLHIVATDGHQMSVATSPITGEVAPFALSVHAKALGACEKWLADERGDTPIAFAHDVNRVWVSSPSRTFICRILDKQYPSWERVMKRGGSTWSATINAEALLSVLKRQLVVSKQESKTVKVTVEGDCVRVSTRSDRGTADDLVASEGYDGAPLTFAISGAYMAATIAALNAGTFEMGLKDEVSPIAFSLVDDKARHNCIVMPMRL